MLQGFPRWKIIFCPLTYPPRSRWTSTSNVPPFMACRIRHKGPGRFPGWAEQTNHFFNLQDLKSSWIAMVSWICIVIWYIIIYYLLLPNLDSQSAWLNFSHQKNVPFLRFVTGSQILYLVRWPRSKVSTWAAKISRRVGGCLRYFLGYWLQLRFWVILPWILGRIYWRTSRYV